MIIDAKKMNSVQELADAINGCGSEVVVVLVEGGFLTFARGEFAKQILVDSIVKRVTGRKSS